MTQKGEGERIAICAAGIMRVRTSDSLCIISILV